LNAGDSCKNASIGATTGSDPDGLAPSLFEGLRMPPSTAVPSTAVLSTAAPSTAAPLAKPIRRSLWTAAGVALTALGCAPPGPLAAESATDGLRHSVDVGPPLSARISYLRNGDASGPRVILVHGTPGSASGWADYVLKPPVGMEVVALDRPGFGASGPSGAVTGLAAQAAAVIALLPSDGRPVVLLGHSLGGPIVAYAAAQLAAAPSTQLRGVVLLAGSLDPAQEDVHPMQHVGTWAPVRFFLPRTIRNANAELMALKPELVALQSLLGRINTKVVIVHGSLDDLVPVANVPFMQAHITGARCVQTTVLEGRNHFLPWNSEDRVRQAIAAALEPACS
jgi:pimeloyl-ACP methyl ester carboxylesterase